jgi:hypothetical protein
LNAIKLTDASSMVLRVAARVIEERQLGWEEGTRTIWRHEIADRWQESQWTIVCLVAESAITVIGYSTEEGEYGRSLMGRVGPRLFGF